MFGIGGGFSKQDSQSGSQSTSNAGFSTGWKDSVSDTAVNRLVGMSDVAEDMVRNQAVPQFQFSQRFPGLFKQQEGFADAFAKQLFSGVSGSAAARGQMSPFNVPGIVGSALTKAAPTLLPLIGQNLQNAMVVPETIRTQRFQNAMSPLQALIAGLGSSSQGSSFSESSGMGANANFSFGGGGGGGGLG